MRYLKRILLCLIGAVSLFVCISLPVSAACLHKYDNRGYCAKCKAEYRITLASINQVYIIQRNNVWVYKRPYRPDQKPSEFRTNKQLAKGTPVSVVNSGKNSVGNWWYKLDDATWIWSNETKASCRKHDNRTVYINGYCNECGIIESNYHKLPNPALYSDTVSWIQTRDGDLFSNMQCYQGVVHCINSSKVDGIDTRHSLKDYNGIAITEKINFPASIIDPSKSTFCSSCLAKISGTYDNWDTSENDYNSVNCVWFTRAKLSYLLGNAYDTPPPSSQFSTGEQLIVRGIPLYTAYVYKGARSWESLFEGLDSDKKAIHGMFSEIGGIVPGDVLIFQTKGHTFLVDYFDGEYFYFTDNNQATTEILLAEKERRIPNQIEVRKWTAKEIINQYKNKTLVRVTVLKYKEP